jgi:hypothetical protein
MTRQPAIQWQRAGALEFFESDQYAGNGQTGRIITIRAAEGDPHHWLTIPAGQLAATGWELAAAAGTADLLGREIRSLYSSINGRCGRGATRDSLLMDRNRLAGLLEAHMITAGHWNGSGEPMTLVQSYGVDQFGISLAELTVMIDAAGR